MSHDPPHLIHTRQWPFCCSSGGHVVFHGQWQHGSVSERGKTTARGKDQRGSASACTSHNPPVLCTISCRTGYFIPKTLNFRKGACFSYDVSMLVVAKSETKILWPIMNTFFFSANKINVSSLPSLEYFHTNINSKYFTQPRVSASSSPIWMWQVRSFFLLFTRDRGRNVRCDQPTNGGRICN